MARAVGFIGIYIEKCAFRHGPDGHGNGMSAPSKAQRHRDFGNVQIQDDTEGAPPSDDERRMQAAALAASCILSLACSR